MGEVIVTVRAIKLLVIVVTEMSILMKRVMMEIPPMVMGVIAHVWKNVIQMREVFDQVSLVGLVD